MFHNKIMKRDQGKKGLSDKYIYIYMSYLHVIYTCHIYMSSAHYNREKNLGTVSVIAVHSETVTNIY